MSWFDDSPSRPSTPASRFSGPFAVFNWDDEKDWHSTASSSSLPATTSLASIMETKLLDSAPQQSGRDVHGWRWFVTCVTLYSMSLLYGLDITIAASVQGAVAERFHEVQKIGWIGIGFPLGSVCTILTIGAACGRFDLKRMLQLSVLFFEVGSAICGAAPSMNVLILGRVVAGVGGAGMYIASINMLSVFTTIQERPMYIGLAGLSWGVGTILGPVVGGLFTDNAPTWRWAFYINLVIAAVFLPAYIFVLPSYQPQPTVRFMKKLASMDWAGTILFIGICVPFIMALTLGGVIWPWDDLRMVALWFVCATCLLAFCLQQRFLVMTTFEDRIFPAQFLYSRSILCIYLCTASAISAVGVVVYFIPLYFQFAHGDSALTAAVRLLPFIVLLIVALIFNGALMPLLGYYMPWYVASGILTLIGGCLLHTITISTSAGYIYAFEIVTAIGAGLSMQAGYSIAEAKYQHRDIPAIVGLINIAQIGSTTIALSIASSVFQNRAIANLTKMFAGGGYTDADIASAVAGAQSPIFQTAPMIIRYLAVTAIVKALKDVWILVIIAGAILLLSSLLMRPEKLFQKKPSASKLPGTPV